MLGATSQIAQFNSLLESHERLEKSHTNLERIVLEMKEQQQAIDEQNRATIAQLQATIAQLQATVTEQHTRIANLEGDVAVLRSHRVDTLTQIQASCATIVNVCQSEIDVFNNTSKSFLRDVFRFFYDVLTAFV